MNPDSMPKTRSVWPTLQVKIVRQKWVRIGMLQPAEHYIPSYACWIPGSVLWMLKDVYVYLYVGGALY